MPNASCPKPIHPICSAEMKAREAQLKNFFQNVDVATRGVDQTSTVARWTEAELELHSKLTSVQVCVVCLVLLGWPSCRCASVLILHF